VGSDQVWCRGWLGSDRVGHRDGDGHVIRAGGC